MWLAAGNVYAATLLQSSFWATFHTLLPSIIVAIARSLPRSELCLLHALCYANMSATLFACRPSNVNHMFTPNGSHASFVVRVENQSAIPGVITISIFFLGISRNSMRQKCIDGAIASRDLVDLLWCTLFHAGRGHISKTIVCFTLARCCFLPLKRKKSY